MPKFVNMKRRHNLKNDLNIKKKKETIENVITLSFLLICVFGLFYSYIKSEDYELNNDELVNLELTLDEKPSIITRAKGGKLLRMNIREYPDFRFNISGITYKATQTSNLTENTEGGSRITLTIDKEDYLQKLVQSKEITFWKKYVNFNQISIYGIKDEKQTYLSKSSYEEKKRSDYKWCFIGIIGFLAFIGYVELKDRKRKSCKK